MGWRYRKSIKIAPGVRVNLGKKSRSITVGGKFHRTTFSSTGRVTKSTSIPGTGLHYTTTSRSGRKQPPKNAVQYSPRMYKFCGVTMYILAALALLIGLVALAFTAFGVVIVLFAALLFFVGRKYIQFSKEPEEETEEEIKARLENTFREMVAENNKQTVNIEELDDTSLC